MIFEAQFVRWWVNCGMTPYRRFRSGVVWVNSCRISVSVITSKLNISIHTPCSFVRVGAFHIHGTGRILRNWSESLLYRADDLIRQHGLDKEFDEKLGSYWTKLSPRLTPLWAQGTTERPAFCLRSTSRPNRSRQQVVAGHRARFECPGVLQSARPSRVLVSVGVFQSSRRRVDASCFDSPRR